MTGLSSLAEGYRAVVFGASGGLGAAFVDKLVADPRCAAIHAGARRPIEPAAEKIIPFNFDLMDEASIVAAAGAIAAHGAPDLIILATGVLHDHALSPEKTMRALNAAALVRAFELNAIGPGIIAKHVLPLLPRDRKAVFAALSARVGSISDNRKGGWHAYRAAKAALNMLIRTCAIELAVRHPLAVCLALHPGTVDTAMSKPFQSAALADQLLTPAQSAAALLQVMNRLGSADSGGFFAWDGKPIPY